MDHQKVYAFFWNALLGVITILVLGIVILARGYKEKTEFLQVEGKLIYLEKTYLDFHLRNPGKYRYLSIDNYPKTFELFIGKDFGDFKPKFERIDELKIGDEIKVYFDENSEETDSRISRLVQFIDKNEEPYFVRGGGIDRTIGVFCLSIGILIGGILIYLKKTGKIQ